MGVDAAVPRFFGRYVKPGMTIYDVGANKGQMTLLFARLVGSAGRVISVEPAATEFASLKRNIALNGLDSVAPYCAAASDREGSLTLAYDSDHPTQGKLVDVEPTYQLSVAKAFTIPTIKLDDLTKTAPLPDFIKIDVEGAAAAVMRGARRILDSRHAIVFLELHGPEEQAGVRDELLARGYVATTLGAQVVDDPTAGWFSPLICLPPRQ